MAVLYTLARCQYTTNAGARCCCNAATPLLRCCCTAAAPQGQPEAVSAGALSPTSPAAPKCSSSPGGILLSPFVLLTITLSPPRTPQALHLIKRRHLEGESRCSCCCSKLPAQYCSKSCSNTAATPAASPATTSTNGTSTSGSSSCCGCCTMKRCLVIPFNSSLSWL